MNTEDLATMFEAFGQGLASGLTTAGKKDLASVAAMLHRFPNQSVADFVKFVEGSFLKERNSVPALADRFRAFRDGQGESREELEASARALSAADLKKLVKVLGLAPAASKNGNLTTLAGHLSGQGKAGSSSHSASESTPHEQIDQVHGEYQALRRELATLSFDELRRRFDRLATAPKVVLAGVAQRIGFAADGSREDLAKRLLGNLESIKVSQHQTGRI